MIQPFLSFNQDVQFTSVAKIPVEDFNFFVDTVFIKNEDEKTVGYYDDKLEDTLYFEESISKTFNNLFSNSFPYRKDKNSLVVVVHKIFINSDRNYDNIELGLSFYSQTGGQLLYLYTTGDIFLMENKSSNKRPSKRAFNVILALETLIERFNDRVINKEIESVAFSTNDLNQIKNHVPQFPIVEAMKSKNNTRGVFRTYDDFLYNRIDKGVGFKTTKIDKYPDATKVDVDPFKEEDSLWGHSDGGSYFKKIGRYFYKLEYNDTTDQIYFYGPLSSTDSKSFIPNLLGISTTMVTSFFITDRLNRQNGARYRHVLVAAALGAVAGTIVDFVTGKLINKEKMVKQRLNIYTGSGIIMQ